VTELAEIETYKVVDLVECQVVAQHLTCDDAAADAAFRGSSRFWAEPAPTAHTPGVPIETGRRA
jgi:hypothetical protein